jgi:hypothetical protein
VIVILLRHGHPAAEDAGIPVGSAYPHPVSRRGIKRRQERVAKGIDEILLLMCVSKEISQNGQNALSRV